MAKFGFDLTLGSYNFKKSTSCVFQSLLGSPTLLVLALITVFSFLLGLVPPVSFVTYSGQFCLLCFAAYFQIVVIFSMLHDYFTLEYLYHTIDILYD